MWNINSDIFVSENSLDVQNEKVHNWLLQGESVRS
jgi:hypothetical protein